MIKTKGATMIDANATKPACHLGDLRGNSALMIGRVMNALMDANQHKLAFEFRKRAVILQNHPEKFLNVVREYVEVQSRRWAAAR